MASIRQEKVARVIKEVVSDAIQNRLNDPRIEGFTSVTRVNISPDLRNADVFLSIMGTKTGGRHKTFMAIEHASKYIRMLLGRKLTGRVCPKLSFYEDESFKKILDTMKLIDEAAEEWDHENGAGSDRTGGSEAD